MAITMILGILAAALLVAAVVMVMRLVNRALDKAGYRIEHIILAPFRRFVWFEGVSLEKLPCRPCGGLGVQVLLGGTWTVIPPELRDRQITGSHPQLANTRRCPRCHGLGHRWVRVT